MDYCNSVLYGANDTGALGKLQLIQNNAARIVSLRRKYDHITPVLQDLHWLPVKHRINFKILLMTYKALNSKAPEYIAELVNLYVPRRANMRSENKYELYKPRYNKERFGRRSFAIAAPTLWNRLPMDIRKAPSVDTFKSKLKTHLFKLAYML